MFSAMKSVNLSQIQARRKRIAEAIGEHESGIAALRAEDAELDVAERVFMRLATENDFRELAKIVGTGATAEAKAEQEAESGKPPGIPTMPDMIREALKHALSRNVLGLEPTDMLAYIRGRYWSTAQQQNVGPIAWRMHKRGQLLKRGSYYRLPKEETENGQAASGVPASGLA